MAETDWHRTPEEEAAIDEAYVRDLYRWGWVAVAVLAWTLAEYLLKMS